MSNWVQAVTRARKGFYSHIVRSARNFSARLGCALAASAALVLLAGCGDRKGSIEAAQQLADKLYPGQLKVIGANLQKTYYDVIFAPKGDPFTRVRLEMPRDPWECRLRTDCERSLRKAYADGRARGQQLKAMNNGMRACGVPLLAILPRERAYAIELDLGLEDQQPALDRLGRCMKAYAAAYGEPMRHRFLIFRPREGTPAEVGRQVTPDTQLDRDRKEEPAYHILAEEPPARLRPEDLSIDRDIYADGPVHDQIVEAAQAVLRKERPKAVMRRPYLFWAAELDPQRIDIVRAYLMACSEDREGRCKEDLALRITYDLTRRTLAELTLLDAPHGLRALPDLPSRQPNGVKLTGGRAVE